LYYRMTSGYVLAIVGATTLIGQELLKILPLSTVRVNDLRLFDAVPGGSTKTWFDHREIAIREIGPYSFDDVDIVVLLDRMDSVAWLLSAARQSARLVITAYPWSPERETAPLIVPEINPEAVNDGFVSCPHVLTSQTLVVLYPLHRVASLQSATIDAFEATSAAGRNAMGELSVQARQVLRGRPAVPHAHPHQIAFNLLPETSVFLDNGYTRAEWSIIEETRRVLGLPALPVSVTVIRAPVHVGNAAVLYAHFEHAISPDEARSILANSTGLRVQDDPSISLYPHPWNVVGTDQVHVGRIREDQGKAHGLAMWIAADNLRKGAATNIVQIIQIARLRGVL
jgi:aspartate-semialdehyde dehydrogenase